jgi:tRNA-2-methylthio-N6-dimethylallyladenosine synthase
MSTDEINIKPASRMRVFLETFGCQMNILDSELVHSKFKAEGHEFVSDAESANVVLLNTCSVRDLSEQKILSRLGILKERKAKGEKLVVGVLGCMAERSNDELIKSRPFIDVMVGPSKIHETLPLVEKAFSEEGHKSTKTSLSGFVKRKGGRELAQLSPMDELELLDKLRPTESREQPWQAYVRITRGCNKFCSFCVVPRTRGPEMHRPPLSIIDEVKRLVDYGALEVTLLGQTINHYFYDENSKHWSFADLLFQIHEQVPDLKRLRFLTSYPRDFSDEALDVMKTSDRICKYLHIPAQSGSNKILKAMNRGYDLDCYLSLIERARSRMPNIAFLGDMIVGFPGETDEDFQASLDLLNTVRYKNVYVFKYSPRPNTVAFERFADHVPQALKKERNNHMLELQRNITFEQHLAMIGQKVDVICEGAAKNTPEDGLGLVQLGRPSPENIRLTGRSSQDHIIHFEGPLSLKGQLLPVHVVHARQLSLSGVLI